MQTCNKKAENELIIFLSKGMNSCWGVISSPARNADRGKTVTDMSKLGGEEWKPSAYGAEGGPGNLKLKTPRVYMRASGSTCNEKGRAESDSLAASCSPHSQTDRIYPPSQYRTVRLIATLILSTSSSSSL